MDELTKSRLNQSLGEAPQETPQEPQEVLQEAPQEPTEIDNGGVIEEGVIENGVTTDYEALLKQRDEEITRLKGSLEGASGLSSEIQKMEKDGRSQAEIREYIELKSGDMTDEQAIKKQIALENKTLTPAEVDALYEHELGNYENETLRTAVIKQRAKAARTKLNEFVSQYQTIEKQAPQVAEAPKTLKFESTINDASIGDVPFEVELTEAEVAPLAEQVINHYKQQGISATSEQIQEGVKRMAVMEHHDKLIQSAIRHGIAVGKKGRVERSAGVAEGGKVLSPPPKEKADWLSELKRKRAKRF